MSSYSSSLRLPTSGFKGQLHKTLLFVNLSLKSCPAYGSANAYTSTLPIPTPEAISLWSYPRSTADITSIFQCYLSGALPAIPWSEEGGLSAETRTIKDQLLKLNEKGWWTVASQPAVNGLDSADETFGWGPRMGFVWQKVCLPLLFFCARFAEVPN